MLGYELGIALPIARWSTSKGTATGCRLTPSADNSPTKEVILSPKELTERSTLTGQGGTLFNYRNWYTFTLPLTPAPDLQRGASFGRELVLPRRLLHQLQQDRGAGPGTGEPVFLQDEDRWPRRPRPLVPTREHHRFITDQGTACRRNIRQAV